MNVAPLRNVIRKMRPTTGLRNEAARRPKPKSARENLRLPSQAAGGRVSGSTAKHKIAATRAMMADTIKLIPSGVIPGKGGSVCAKYASGGPTTNPNRNIPPKIPNAWVRCSGVVMSLTTAWATELLPPVRPSNMRARYSHQANGLTAASTFATTVPSKLITSRGLRPIRSDSRPRIGVPTNCDRENAVVSKLAAKSLRPNSLA